MNSTCVYWSILLAFISNWKRIHGQLLVGVPKKIHKKTQKIL
jgi:hypothetical protein